jgi:lambda family phage tail tape measure protein
MAREIRVALILDDSRFTRPLRNANAELDQFEKRGTRAGKNVMDSLEAIGWAALGAGIIKVANDYQNLQNKLIAVTGSQSGANTAFENIKRIAEETRSPLNAIGDLYSKLAIGTREAGKQAKDVSDLTRTFAQTLQLSGTSGQQASAAILQFGQAMASGKLSGDEFRAMMEYNPVLMMKFAEAVGVPIGELRKLAAEGAITAKALELGMKGIAPEVQDEFGKMNTTIGNSFTLIANNFIIMLANIESKFGIFQGLANLLKTLADNTQLFATVAAAAFGAGVARLVFGLASAMMFYRAQVVKTTFAQATLLALGGPAGLAALAAGVIAAGVAYSQLSGLMDENTAKSEAKAAADEAAFKAKTEEAKLASEEAKKELAKGAAAAAAAKAAKKAAEEAQRAADARLRAAARNLQSINENIAQLNVETDLLGKRLDLDLRLVGTAEDYADKQRRLFDIEKERDKTIAEIRAKELDVNPIKNAELKAKKEADVNAQYDKQVKSLDKLIETRREEARLAGAKDASKIGREGQAAVNAINAEFDARQFLYDYQKRNAVETQKINDKAADAEAVLRENSKNMDKGLFDIKLANIKKNQKEELAALDAVTKAEADKNATSISFSEGIAEAQRNLAKLVADEAAYSQQLFNTAMNGFADSLLNFVKTGKLSFKDLFASLMAEMIKMQALKLFNTFFGKGGVLGGLFAGPTPVPGARAVGGPVMAGQPYIVGERGPELFVPSGPGTVQANGFGRGGATQVTYNIQAVDARSFKELVARDPEFIYSVTQVGARRIPR